MSRNISYCRLGVLYTQTKQVQDHPIQEGANIKETTTLALDQGKECATKRSFLAGDLTIAAPSLFCLLSPSLVPFSSCVGRSSPSLLSTTRKPLFP